MYTESLPTTFRAAAIAKLLSIHRELIIQLRDETRPNVKEFMHNVMAKHKIELVKTESYEILTLFKQIETEENYIVEVPSEAVH